MRVRRKFTCFLFCILFAVIFLVLYFVEDEKERVKQELEDILNTDDRFDKHDPEGEAKAKQEDIQVPIIIWWTPFSPEKGREKKCGAVSCFFTKDRHYWSHKNTKAFMFYGTSFEAWDLPLPRKQQHEWALLHEESPKNNYLFSFEDIMTLFNHTATFRRQSDYPLTTQHLGSIDWLQRTDFVVPTAEKNELLKELAPLVYTHSDCGTPSDRDKYVDMLRDLIPVDSYGKCLHNKDLPDHLKEPIPGMDHRDFYKLLAKYKFTLAFENAYCEDYITEKVWRPLFMGSVPIIKSSPKIKDFLPANNSAILVDDFKSVAELAQHIKYVNSNDEAYNKYLEWKTTGITNQNLLNIMKNREWHITEPFSEYNYNMNFIDGFECFVCKRLHENIQRKKENKEEITHRATVDHYGCPFPQSFDDTGRYNKRSTWDYEWIKNAYLAKATRFCIDRNAKCNRAKLHKLSVTFEKEDMRDL